MSEIMVHSTDDPTARMANLMARLFYYMADECIKTMGTDGEKIVLKAITRFGHDRVNSIQAEAQEKGLDPTSFTTYRLLRDMPSDGWKRDIHDPSKITYCPMEEAWHHYGLQGEKIGALYCTIDNLLYQSFGKELIRKQCKTHGDTCCTFQCK